MEFGGTFERGYALALARQTIRPLLVSSAYVALFSALTQLTTNPPAFGSWNLAAGLSFGVVLGYGLAYAPVVLIAYSLIGFQHPMTPLGAWHAVFPALVVTGVYVTAAEAIR
jgi:hypothetical protein